MKFVVSIRRWGRGEGLCRGLCEELTVLSGLHLLSRGIILLYRNVSWR